MADVIPLRPGGAKPETPQARATRAREQAARIQERKHTAIWNKIKDKDNKIMRKPSERLRVANNLWQILTDLENGVPPVSKKVVLREAGQGRDTDLTKRLPYFAVNPELSKEEPDKRASKLTQHIDRYVKLVRHAARLSGRNENVLIERLVEGTRYSWSPGDPESVEDLGLEGWRAVDEKIREVSKEIAGKHDLQGFFRRVLELGIGVDSKGNFDQPAGRSEIYAAAFQKEPLPAFIRTDELPPRPSVELGEIRSGDFPCTIRLRATGAEGK